MNLRSLKTTNLSVRSLSKSKPRARASHKANLVGLCALRFMVLRLHMFIFANLVGLCVLPGGLMRAWVAAWAMQAAILIKLRAVYKNLRKKLQICIKYQARSGNLPHPILSPYH